MTDQLLNLIDTERASIQTKFFADYTGCQWGGIKDLNVLHLNIRSLNKNLSQLIAILSTIYIEFHLIVLTETWVAEDDNTTYDIPGYETYHKKGFYNKCDGVTIFAKTLSEFAFEFSVPQDIVEASAVQVKLTFKKRKTIDLLCVYRPPSCDPNLFIHSLSLHMATKSGVKALVGDINIDILDPEKAMYIDDYLDNMSAAGLLSFINNHTRVTPQTKSCLDHMFCSESNAQGAIFNCHITDHYPTMLKLPDFFNDRVAKRTLPRSVEKINHVLLAENFRSESWDSVSDLSEVDDISLALSAKIKNCIETAKETITLRENRYSKKQPWITSHIITQMKLRDNLYTLSKRQPFNVRVLEQARKARNKTNVLIRQAKKDYYREKIENSENSSKEMWKQINSITGNNPKSKCIKSVKNVNGELVTERVEVANTFNKFFTEIGSKMAEKLNHRRNTHFPSRNKSKTIFLNPVSETEVKTLIMSLKNGSSSGFDGVSSRILKDQKEILCKPLAHLINACFQSGQFPKNLKKTIIIPIHKKSDKTEVTNYRPIALTSNIAKVIEKAFKTRVMHFLESNKYLHKNQFGFREKKSTIDPVLKLVNSVHHTLNNGKKALTVFIDLQKAFDSISHSKLLSALYETGVRGKAHDFVTSYLSNRLQVVKVSSPSNENGESSEHFSADMTSAFGIPQGSVLGPVLFIIFINELSNIAKFGTVLSFADDTAITFYGDTWDEVYKKANKDLSTIKMWLDSKGLSLNIDKTVYLAYSYNSSGQPSNNLTLKIHTQNCVLDENEDCECSMIKKTKFTKYLGVVLDENLKWQEHLKQTCKRLRQSLYKFRRLRDLFDKPVLRQVYFAISHSVVDYAMPAWGGAFVTHTKKLEKTMNLLLRVILKKSPRSHAHDLYTEFNVPNFYQMYAKAIAKTVLKRKIELSRNTQTRSTRSNSEINYIVPLMRSESMRHSPAVIAAKLFNSMPTHLREIQIKNLSKIYKYLNDLERNEILRLLF